MGQTLAEKILSVKTGKNSVSPGDFLRVPVDVVMAHDINAGIAIDSFRAIGAKRVFDPEKIVLIIDHNVPAKTDLAAAESRKLREFAREFGIKYHEIGRTGICHAFMPEQGFALPGNMVVGSDSHTCTLGAVGSFATGMGSTDIGAAMATGDVWIRVPHSIKLVFNGNPGRWISGKDLILFAIGEIGVTGALYASVEFSGEAVESLPMDGRFTMSNMAIEAGGKVGLHHVDQTTLNYVNQRAKHPYTVFEPDDNAQYDRVFEWDVTNLEPQVAFPFLPSNTRSISQVDDIEIQQAVVGSCTNGRLDDLRIAARVMIGKKVHPDVRFIVNPATQEIYLAALREGLIETFVEAGAVISPPACGPCSSSHTWLLAPGERCVATTNRNFVKRMGGERSEVYLASPAVTAASAVTGRISSPKEVVS
jgi:3-isopropylmalate/(R)-2-methylmalate dehydratase large subunit